MQSKKRLTAILLALLVLVPASAWAADSYRFEAKVSAANTTTVELPFEGKIDELLVEAGDHVMPGDKLLTMQKSELLAKEPGTVEAVFAEPGADGKSIEETYHASVILRPQNPLYIVVSNKTAAPGKENITYTRGETLYIKAKSGHTGIGRIINVKSYTFTVEVLSGDLVEGDSTNVFRSETYANSKRLGNGAVKYFDLTMMNMDGFVIDVPVKVGDSVSPGDVLLTYAPSTELSAYAKEEAIVLSADASGAVILAPVASLCLTAKLSAAELSLLEARKTLVITQDGNPEFEEEGHLKWISGVADESGLFEVRIECPATITPRIGAAYQIEAK